eukprot:Phypoly_transcript_15097.p1 GENE.Phypoly_transcript_15097~~Phypoly_transcript_15097.p1  ORF type:complete len:282 (-),score=37.24 Phypoly_transcript_15097:32-877(-)
MPFNKTTPKLSSAELYQRLSLVSSIYIFLEHQWAGQTINNKFPKGLCAGLKFGEIVCNVTGVNYPAWVRLKIYARPESNCTADLIEVDYVLASNANQKIQLDTDGKATFLVHAIIKYMKQTRTLPRFNKLNFFLGVDLLDKDDNILVQSIDNERPFFVTSSNQKTSPVNKRRKFHPHSSQSEHILPSPIIHTLPVQPLSAPQSAALTHLPSFSYFPPPPPSLSPPFPPPSASQAFPLPPTPALSFPPAFPFSPFRVLEIELGIETDNPEFATNLEGSKQGW